MLLILNSTVVFTVVIKLLNLLTQGCEDESVVEPVALQLCARKVAAVAGDIRKALDVCR